MEKQETIASLLAKNHSRLPSRSQSEQNETLDFFSLEMGKTEDERAARTDVRCATERRRRRMANSPPSPCCCCAEKSLRKVEGARGDKSDGLTSNRMNAVFEKSFWREITQNPSDTRIRK